MAVVVQSLECANCHSMIEVKSVSGVEDVTNIAHACTAIEDTPTLQLVQEEIYREE